MPTARLLYEASPVAIASWGLPPSCSGNTRTPSKAAKPLQKSKYEAGQRCSSAASTKPPNKPANAAKLQH